MSYTAPTDVQTKADAVLALASTIAGEDKTALGNGSVNKALDVLADVLAQQDVDVPQTNAGAILALAQYVGGGGGGDFTIAQVTITYDHEDTTNGGILLPVAEEAYPPLIPEARSAATRIDFSTDTPRQVILYKGKCNAGYFGTGTVTTSGNITYQHNEFLITGDGSITVS